MPALITLALPCGKYQFCHHTWAQCCLSPFLCLFLKSREIGLICHKMSLHFCQEVDVWEPKWPVLKQQTTHRYNQDWWMTQVLCPELRLIAWWQTNHLGSNDLLQRLKVFNWLQFVSGKTNSCVFFLNSFFFFFLVTWIQKKREVS